MQATKHYFKTKELNLFSYLDDRKKEKENFFNITWRRYTANHTANVPEIKMAVHRYAIESFRSVFLIRPGSGCKKNIKIKGTLNYYFKTIGYCSRTKFNLELSKTYEVLCNLAQQTITDKVSFSISLVIFLISQHINELNSLTIFSTATPHNNIIDSTVRNLHFQ